MKFALPARYAWYGYGRVSRPEAAVSSYNNIPPETRAEMRELLSIFLPQLADCPLCYQQLCWDADTVDDNFLITNTPESEKVLLATGGSYHAFKFFPTIGHLVVRALEGGLDDEARQSWGWREYISGAYSSRGKGETRVLKRSTDRSQGARL